MRTGLGRSTTGVAIAAVALTLAGCGPAGDPLGDPSPAGGGKPASEALADLKKLEVKGRAPMTGFDRDEFGPAWADVDHNGCDTRNDILKRDLEGETFKKGTQDCIVLTGTLRDPYSGRTIEFERGQKTSMAVQIDHVVALADAWQKGARQLSKEERRQLANDPLNLLAVDGPLNGQKSAADAATWLPPRRAYRCPYVTRQIQVKVKYELWVTSAEKDAMERVLKAC
ncbi:deoxyribonuclease [Planomonospora sphaerica]|uniref:Deoxyribonuclease n=1 Tax=Planomonospora sphaerica TaxID=161355 RepID=A0A171CJX3_9ACTN|nr:HNH endonuclease family protein [Planomonospora sphaerica]GAT66817.1 deoxyribonuclease [Planomonospora sphaerica]